MQEINFKRTGHTLLNNGIIGVYIYLNKAQKENRFDFPFEFDLSNSALSIKSEKLPELLEELYYRMGKEVYDTYTSKQLENAEKRIDCNVYYDEAKDDFIYFQRIASYGYPVLLHNGKTKNTRSEKNQSKLSILEEKDKNLYERFKEVYSEIGNEKGSIIYLNERYTTIPRLPIFDKKYFTTSDKSQKCYYTGESYDKLIGLNNNYLFISKQGIDNFKPYFKNIQYNVSWKSMYLVRFAAVNAFYHYTNNFEALHVYFLESDNLPHLDDVLRKVELHIPNTVLRSQGFKTNIRLPEELKKEVFSEYFEVALSLIISLYKKILKEYGGLDEDQVPDEELFDNVAKEIPPLAIDSFKADAFASTMRPNTYENINRLSVLMRLFYVMESKGINFNRFLSSLKILRPSERNSRDKYRLERVLRNHVSEEIIKGKSILNSIEDLYFRTYNYICSSEYVGFKDYKQLSLFLEIYESKFNTMDETLQQAAINLGKQIGVKMRHHDDSQSDASNAKKGRGDLITLRKARTHKQFLDELIRIDFKYGLTVNEELANKINEQNYYTIKQFLIIGALNILNPAIHSKPEKVA